MAKKRQHSDIALVIVESPAKARTISKYLGAGFDVESCLGHVRDLPSTASEIPVAVKQEPWARLGVNVDEGFAPVYVVPQGKKARVAKLRQLMKRASALYLATDEDREGEAIAWHLTEVLKPDVPVKRMVFDEITRGAITEAVRKTRGIDLRLVNAQEARRILDRLFGYEVSPVLWRKVGPKLSAGRVQSVATRLVVVRERARMRFAQAEYWDIEAELDVRSREGGTISVRLVELGGKRVAEGKDFDDTTGELKGDGKVVWLGETQARAVASVLESASFTVSRITTKPFVNRPYAPFITSTLQQEAGRKLRYGAQRTMRLAQSLYENGYITYMRTDSTHLSGEAITAARKQITELYGADYVPDKPRKYVRKAKNAQEAHEAIRPAGGTFRTPKSVEGELEPDAWKLYELIWKRTVASQMKDAQGMRTGVRIQADAGEHGTAVFSTSGKVIRFPGFLRAYVEGSDDPEAKLEDQERILPPLAEGDDLGASAVRPAQHTTQPPARYTEASLVRELEERGIGRPSTYASVIQTIQDRGYVWQKGSALVPTFTAFAVVNLLEQHLGSLVDYDFTAKMENDLDAIASGEREAVPWLHDFYFGQPNGNGRDGIDVAAVGLKALIGSGQEAINPRAVSCIPLGTTPGGETVAVRVGRYGPYAQVGNSDLRASVPGDMPPDEMTMDKALDLIEQALHGDHMLGEDPETGKPVYVKTGRFGPYVQLGDPELTAKGNIRKGSKPKMVSLWPSMTIEDVTLDQALMLLSFPREVGKDPDTDEVITVQDGRYGPYIKRGTETRSLEAHEQMGTITLEQAVELFKQPRVGRRRAPAVLSEIGKHPTSGAAIQVRTGRYGPYVTDGAVNARIPKGQDPAKITLDQAIELIDARQERLRDQGKDPPAKAEKRRAKSGGRKPAESGPTEKRTAGTKPVGKKTPKKKIASASGKKPKAKAATEQFGPAAPGFAWTRNGNPVVEDWPAGTLACPQCGAGMVLRRGRYGPFYACAEYPKCNMKAGLRGEAKRRAEEEVPQPVRAKSIPTGLVCDECGAAMVIRRSRGRPFLGCSAFPNCKSTKPLPADLEELAASGS